MPQCRCRAVSQRAGHYRRQLYPSRYPRSRRCTPAGITRRSEEGRVGRPPRSPGGGQPTVAWPARGCFRGIQRNGGDRGADAEAVRTAVRSWASRMGFVGAPEPAEAPAGQPGGLTRRATQPLSHQSFVSFMRPLAGSGLISRVFNTPRVDSIRRLYREHADRVPTPNRGSEPWRKTDPSERTLIRYSDAHR